MAEWFAKSANDKNDLRKLVPLYFLGVAIYGRADEMVRPKNDAHPRRVGSFLLFMAALLAPLVIIKWMGLTVLCRTRNDAV